MRYAQGGGLTAERRVFRERLRMEAAGRYPQGEETAVIARDLRVTTRSARRAGPEARESPPSSPPSSPPPCGTNTGRAADRGSCLTARSDALSELADAVLCSDGPVRSLAELSLVGEHRRGHGGLYAAVARGRVDAGRLQRALAAVPLPRTADGRLLLAAPGSA